MQRRDYITINKILTEIADGFEILGDTNLQDFLNSKTLTHAIAMVEINIGELVKVITPELKEKYSDIPWKPIAGMRDIAAHQYQAINFEDVYNSLKDDFSELAQQLQDILNIEILPKEKEQANNEIQDEKNEKVEQ